MQQSIQILALTQKRYRTPVINNHQQLATLYAENGYFVIRNYFDDAQITALREVVLTFHELWKTDNQDFYQTEAFNSSLITGSEYLKEHHRTALFEFISSEKLMAVIDTLIPNKPAFMNTQLFFNPVNPQQKDFWHRDCQYDYDIEDQMRVILETQVLHLRVPLFDELGMEIIPGTHKRWDNEQEYNVRQEVNGKVSSDDLCGGEKIPLAAGDLLVFSADMIHRGLYGLDRLALDILVFDSAADYIDYIDEDCLPSTSILNNISDPRLFMNTLQLISKASS